MLKNLISQNAVYKLAVPRATEYNGLSYFNGKKIATSYPNILQSFLDEKNIKSEIHEISGSVEIAPGIGLADAIFDIVSYWQHIDK